MFESKFKKGQVVLFSDVSYKGRRQDPPPLMGKIINVKHRNYPEEKHKDRLEYIVRVINPPRPENKVCYTLREWSIRKVLTLETLRYAKTKICDDYLNIKEGKL